MGCILDRLLTFDLSGMGVPAPSYVATYRQQSCLKKKLLRTEMDIFGEELQERPKQ
jgi:hypothetical protein